jgi:hypothetical protein
MGAVFLVARAEMRRQFGMFALLAAIVALVSGVVLTAAAGARRTSTVLDRYFDSYPGPELTVGVDNPGFAADIDRVRASKADLVALPFVNDVLALQDITVMTDADVKLGLTIGPDTRYLEASSWILLDGRLPLVDGTGEVAINEEASEALGLGVGDTLTGRTYSPETALAISQGSEAGDVVDGPELLFEVVGVFRDPTTLEVAVTPSGLASPDAGSRRDEVAIFDTAFYLFGDEDMNTEAATAVLDEAVPEGNVYAIETEVWVQPIRTSFDAIALGLGLFALVATGAGLIALGQMVARQVGQASSLAGVVRALGMQHRAVVLASALPSILAVSVGVVIGAIISVAFSPMFPISVARRAEVDPGLRVDWPTLMGGSGFFIATVSVLALAAGWRQLQRPRTDRSWAPPVLVTTLRRALPVTASIGCTSALPTGRRHGAASSRSALVGAVLGVAGVLAIAVFTTSQRATAETSSRLGWGWDSMPDLHADDPWAVIDSLAEDPSLAAVGAASCDRVFTDQSATSACALHVFSGSLSLVYLDGRSPNSPDEVATGRQTLSAAGLELGDSIEVTGQSGATRELEIVGIVVQPDEANPGEGLVLTESGLTRLADDSIEQYLLLKYPAGADTDHIEAALVSNYPLDFTDDSHPRVPESLSQLGRVRPTLTALAAFLGLLGIIGLIHFLLLSASRRRHEAAVLETLGLVGRQTRTVTSWQALTIALIGVVFGTPLGVVVGRAVWIASVDQIGIVDSPEMPWLVAAAIVGVTLVGAVTVSLAPGWIMARRSPAEALRRE